MDWGDGSEDVCSNEQRFASPAKVLLTKRDSLHLLSFYRLPQLCHGSTAVFLEKATSEWEEQYIFCFTLVLAPVEAGEHDDEEGGHVEEEKAREEGAQPGESEEGGADQGEVEHGGGGLYSK